MHVGREWAQDIQRKPPWAYCCRCGGELYRYDPVVWDEGGVPLCGDCAGTAGRQEERGMTLREMSVQYRAQEGVLHGRIRLLTAYLEGEDDETTRGQLTERIRMLNTMRREAGELAVLTERYYERGYRRNVKYTL